MGLYSRSNYSSSLPNILTNFYSPIQLENDVVEDLTPSPGLECSGMIMAHSSLNLPSSSNPPTSASRVVGATGVHHHTMANFALFFIEMRSHYVAQCCPGWSCTPGPKHPSSTLPSSSFPEGESLLHSPAR
ncbi:hypothetical protein AAY473_015301 [Plecturocebus cupreus]